jgi:type IV pilus assembly protein PilX
MSGGSSLRETPVHGQRGMVLVTALLMLLVVTILAVGMFHGFGLDEKIAGNMREKHRAVNAAESAEQYAEWWLSQGNGGLGVICAPPLLPAATPKVCSNPIVAVGDVSALPLPWNVGVTYATTTPTAMNIEGVTAGSAWTEYYSTPTFYIQYLGPSPGGLGTIFKIDAVGYGGSADTAAVVETTYLVQQSVTCSTCGP